MERNVNNGKDELLLKKLQTQISLFVPEILKFLKYANQPNDDVIHSTRFFSNMMNDILARLNQKYLIFCSKILLNVLHNLSLTVLLPWQHTEFQIPPILKAFLATFGMHFHICKWCLIYMIQQAYKYVSLSLWPSLTFFGLKITALFSANQKRVIFSCILLIRK